MTAARVPPGTARGHAGVARRGPSGKSTGGSVLSDFPVTFVGGVPRSGTTLIHAVLCSTPATNPAVAEDRVLRHIALSHEECREQFDRHVRFAFADRDAISAFHREQLAHYVAHQRMLWPEARRLVFKQPMLTIHFPTLADLLPEARFVVVLRDPRAIVASLIEVDRKEQEQEGKPRFGGTMEAYLRMIESYYGPPVRYFRGERRRCCAWLRYEDFVRDPRRFAPILGRAAGVDLSDYDPAAPWRGWHDGTTSREDRRGWSTYAELWGEPVKSGRTETWRETLSPDDEVLIVERLKHFMRAFGYLSSEDSSASAR